MTERVYSTIRIQAGDYLLPSNDMQTLYRIQAYQEDGSAEARAADGKWRPVVGRFWQIAYHEKSLPEFGPDAAFAPNFLTEGWVWIESNLYRKQDAIDAILAREERKA